MAHTEYLIACSSTLLRLFSYVYLRWIPAPQLPGLVIASLTAYISLLVWMQYKVGHFNIDDLARRLTDKPFLVLITGIPSRRHRWSSRFTLIVNACIVFMVLDFTYTTSVMYPMENLGLARVGFVDHNSANIMLRDTRLTKDMLTLQYRKRDEQSDRNMTWSQVRAKARISSVSDYTTTFHLTGLEAASRYEYDISKKHLGSFTTASHPGKHNDDFTFLHSSCILPNFPYSPFRHRLSMPGFKHLARNLPNLKAQFMIFVGDFIYADVPRRVGVSQETYRAEYRRVYASPDWTSVTNQASAQLPWIHVYDDHEIANDWDKNETGVYPAAANAWQLYQASVNPPPVRPGQTYFSFVQGPASFFMLDTRRYRTPFDGSNGTCTSSSCQKSMLGKRQRDDLKSWLKREEPEGVYWKIVISSIPFTKNWRVGWEDTWAGYLGERKDILESMWDVSTRTGVNVIVLSGDRHEFAATKFPPSQEGVTENRWSATSSVYEFSASPLSMFYLPIRTYKQTDDEDITIKYLPDGNSKFGSLTLGKDSTSDLPSLSYRLYIDGDLSWTTTILSVPPRSTND